MPEKNVLDRVTSCQSLHGVRRLQAHKDIDGDDEDQDGELRWPRNSMCGGLAVGELAGNM